MHAKIHLIFFSIVYCLVFFACRTPKESSDIKHEFGNTRTEPVQKISDCTQSSKDISTLYLSDIAKSIMKANLDTFKDVYDSSKFCFDVVIDDKSVNASGNPLNRAVTANAGVILNSENDADVASVIAHELAHITRQHQNRVPQAVQNNPTFIQLTKDIQEHVKIRTELENQVIAFEKIFFDLAKFFSATDLKDIENKKFIFQKNLVELYLFLQHSKSYTLEGEKRRNDLSWKVDFFMQKACWGEEYFNISGISQSACSLPNLPPETSFEKSEEKFNNQFSKIYSDSEKFKKSLIEKFPDFTNKLTLLINEKETVSKKIKQINAVLLDAEQAERKIISEVIGEDAVANWIEQEADEIGFEFYIRAGFSPFFFQTWIERKIKSKSDQDLADCRKKISESTESVSEIVRGTKPHPEDCWRIYDIEVIEKSKHMSEYKDLIHASTKLFEFPGRLKAVKDELSKE